MDYQQSEVQAPKRREYSLLSMLLSALFVVTLAVAVFVDSDGVLEYFQLVSGSPLPTLEMGAFISAACAVPFLMMGMSISADMHRLHARHG